MRALQLHNARRFTAKTLGVASAVLVALAVGFASASAAALAVAENGSEVDAWGRTAVSALSADTNQVVAPYASAKQTFTVVANRHQLRLVPVVYGSRSAHNSVCELVAINEAGSVVGHTRLFGFTSNGSESSFCQEVLGVEFRSTKVLGQLEAVYLLRTRIDIPARNAAAIVEIDTVSGNVHTDRALTAAVEGQSEPHSVSELMQSLVKLKR